MLNLRYLTAVYLYNMLQDFRHLLIFDLRPQKNYQQYHIRDSFNASDETCKEKIQAIIQLAEVKATQKQAKYKQLKRVRRYFFVSDQKLSETDKKLQQILSCLQKDKSKDDKIYALDSSIEAFFKKYEFMCLTQQKMNAICELKQQSKQQESDRIYLYPYSKFPSQIILQKLYLGNIYSSNSQKQLQDLEIKCLIDFIDYSQGEILPEFKESKYAYLNLPFNQGIPANIDFDIINEEIDKHLSKGRTLFYCRDGEIVSPAFAIAYLIYKCNLDINMATLKVCQAISRVEICKWIYTQLLTYKPKK